MARFEISGAAGAQTALSQGSAQACLGQESNAENCAVSPAAEHITGKKVLLTEDNAVNQRLAVRLLEKRGHNITLATNGREAIAAAEKESFDLILMDVQMPEMDGFAATAAIRSREKSTGKHTPIIAMTAHAMRRRPGALSWVRNGRLPLQAGAGSRALCRAGPVARDSRTAGREHFRNQLI